MKLLFLIMFSFTIKAEECFQAKTKIIFEGKDVIAKEELCLRHTLDKMLFYVSKNCINNKCKVLMRPKIQISIKNYKSHTGSPGFKLCETLDGVPQIFEFQKNNQEWQRSERCFFDKNDFVEISLLTYEWKQYIAN